MYAFPSASDIVSAIAGVEKVSPGGCSRSSSLRVDSVSHRSDCWPVSTRRLGDHSTVYRCLSDRLGRKGMIVVGMMLQGAASSCSHFSMVLPGGRLRWCCLGLVLPSSIQRC